MPESKSTRGREIGDKSGGGGRRCLMGLGDHCEDYGFYSERHEESVEGFDQRASLIF